MSNSEFVWVLNWNFVSSFCLMSSKLETNWGRFISKTLLVDELSNLITLSETNLISIDGSSWINSCSRESILISVLNKLSNELFKLDGALMLGMVPKKLWDLICFSFWSFLVFHPKDFWGLFSINKLSEFSCLGIKLKLFWKSWLKIVLLEQKFCLVSCFACIKY